MTAIGVAAAATVPAAGGPPGGLRFAVSLGAGLGVEGVGPGRLFLVISAARGGVEPRRALGDAGPAAPTALACDVGALRPGEAVLLDRSASCFPIASLDQLPSGRYRVQALLDQSRDLRSPNAPGNLFSAVRTVPLDPTRTETVRLELTETIPPERLPRETDRVRYLEVPSRLLSAFHGRPIGLRAGVILPLGFDRDPSRRYPLRVHIGGFGTRFTAVGRMMERGSPFREAWEAPGAPRMVLLHLDGAGPLGDPYQVNSANHGPYGDAITQELIPLVEQRFRCGGSGRKRVLDGVSTGGWVALALQVFYPDAFHGAWSFCPDPVDFQSYQRINIYEDGNAYDAADGTERPAAREPSTGRVRLTMRRECALENLLGVGGKYTLSGQQWGSWNAVFSPRGPDGLPVPLWDPGSGRIDSVVAEQWRQYDLRAILESGWPVLGPKLRGKLRIWVGTADDYYLDEAVRRLEAFLATAEPPYEGSIRYGPGKGHCWIGLDEAAMIREMAGVVGTSEE